MGLEYMCDHISLLVVEPGGLLSGKLSCSVFGLTPSKIKFLLKRKEIIMGNNGMGADAATNISFNKFTKYGIFSIFLLLLFEHEFQFLGGKSAFSAKMKHLLINVPPTHKKQPNADSVFLLNES